MPKIFLSFTIETEEELKRLKEALNMPEFKAFSYETNIDSNYIEQEIQHKKTMNELVPSISSLAEGLQHYQQTKTPLRLKSTKKFNELWGRVDEKETPEIVEYVISAIKDFNELEKLPMIDAFSFEFEAYQGGEEGDEIGISSIAIFDEQENEISLTWDQEDVLADHFYRYAHDRIWYEHLIEDKVYVIK